MRYPLLAQGERVDVLTARSVDQCALARKALVAENPENSDYLDDVARDRAVGVVFMRDDRLVHHGFLFKRNRTADLLGLDQSVALIGNAFTVPACRGQNLQAKSVQIRACVAREEGFEAIVAETSPDNLVSQRGLQKGGMRRLGRLELIVLFNCFVIRWRRPEGFRFLGLVI